MHQFAAFWVVVALVIFALGYRFYAGFLSRRIFDTAEDDAATPATTMTDGVDYVPTSKHVLLGHHFTSVAGAAPIVGPAAACVYGWMPAVLWIVFGVVLIGAMHDYAALVMSVRHEGKSVGDIAGELLGERPRTLFLCLIVILTWLVLAAFASIIATLFDKNPASVVPINLEIPLAVAVGWWYYKKKGGILVPSLIALGIMWGTVFISAQDEAWQFSMPAIAGFTPVQVWVGCLLAYSFVTCMLPVWVLLQPRDFINSHQLFVGLGAIYLAIFVANPELSAPAVNPNPEGAPGPIFPLLFVTIACGAISGFHSLVASGTTSKQISSLRDAKPIGYGSMVGEGCLALAATMAVAAGFEAADWHHHYTPGHALNKGALGNFVAGTANLLQGAFSGLNESIAKTIVAVIVISFAATTLDTACRIQRFCLGELGRAWRIAPLSNRFVASAIAAFTPLALVVETADGVEMWKRIWPVFGSSNQLLGALTLLVVTVWLKRKGKPLWFTGLPAIFLSGVTISGLITLIRKQLAAESAQMAVLLPAILLLLLALAIIAEGVNALRKPPSA
jgi:carbon starvation protein